MFAPVMKLLNNNNTALNQVLYCIQSVQSELRDLQSLYCGNAVAIAVARISTSIKSFDDNT